MIVNPQIFNYRLIIGSLVVVIVILGSFSYKSYDKLKKHETFIQQEKRLVEHELSEMITNYKTINIENDRANISLEGTKDKLKRTLDSLKFLPANASLIIHYKSQLRSVRRENKERLAYADSLLEENNYLKQLAYSYEHKLEAKKTFNDNALLLTPVTYINAEKTPIIEPITTLFKSNKLVGPSLFPILKETPVEKKKNLKPTKFLSAVKIRAQGIKRITPKRIINTKVAARANLMHVSFTIPESKLIDNGTKAVYIQILDPNNNIVGDKGVVSFGDLDLIYSKKITFNYEKDSFKVSTLIKTNTKEPFVTGFYLINIFHNEKRVGMTTIYLK